MAELLLSALVVPHFLSQSPSSYFKLATESVEGGMWLLKMDENKLFLVFHQRSTILMTTTTINEKDKEYFNKGKRA